MSETVSSIKGTIELEDRSWSKTLDSAKRSAQAFVSEGDRLNASARAFMEAEKRAAQEVKRTGEALRQESAFIREMTALEARMTAQRNQESRAAQDVAARYSELTKAEQEQVVAARSAVAAAEAEARAQDKAGQEALRFSNRLRQSSRDMVNAGRALSVGLTGPFLAAGAALLKAGVESDKGLDAIRIATGETGTRLEALRKDFVAVSNQVPNSLEEVGKAIGAVAARTGLTGPPLQALSTRLLTLSRLMGQDLQQTITTSTRLFGDWGVKVRDQSKTLDLLARAHQASNISLTELTRQLVQFGAPLRTVGFSLDQSVALFAKWHKEGVNAAQIATSIRIAISRMVNAGVKDVPAAFQQAIKAISAAKAPADQLALSFKLFGAKAGTDMARAIREGRFSIDDLMRTLEHGKGTISDLAKRTDDFQQAFGILRNQVINALEPLGTRLMDALTRLAENLREQVPRLKDLVAGFLRLPPATQEAAGGIALFVAGLGPALFLLGRLGQAFLGLRAGWAIVVTGANAATTALSSFVVGINAAQVAATARFGLIGVAITATAAFFTAFATNFDGWRDRLLAGLTNIHDSFSNFWKNFATLGIAAWDNLRTRGLSLFTDLAADFTRGLGRLADIWKTGWQRLMNIVSGKGADLRPPGPAAQAVAEFHDLPPGAFAAPKGGGPPALPAVGGSAGGVNPPDWMSRLGKQADAAQNEAKRIARIFASARRTALGAGGPTGDFATAQQQAALKLYSKEFDDLSQSQQKVASSLAQIIVQGEKARIALAAHRKELQAHTQATKEALTAAARLHAQTLDLQRQINQPGPAGHAAQAAARHPLADPAAQAMERQAQAEFDRMKARLALVLKSRQEIDSVDKKIAALEAAHPGYKSFIGPPVPTAFISSQDQLNKRLATDTKRLADLQARQKAESQVTQQVLKEEASGWEALGQVTNDVITRRKELLGATTATASAEERLGEKINFLDLGMVQWAVDALRASHANDALETAQKAAAKAAAESLRIDELLTNTMTDLNAEMATLTGQQPDQTRAINRLQADWQNLTIEQQLQLKQIQGMFKRRELLSSAKQLADGLGSIFGNALEGLSNGFKGFFSGIYQGFRQLLVRMAAEYLASQFQRIVLGGLAALIGGAFGGGGGGGTAVSGGSVLGGGGGFPTAAGGGATIAGRPMLVGERGPELILPRSAGTVVPNNQLAGLGGGGNVTINMTVNTPDVAGFRRNMPQLHADLSRQAERLRRRNG
jgi:TP901 family phage tail tape measure protein